MDETDVTHELLLSYTALSSPSIDGNTPPLPCPLPLLPLKLSLLGKGGQGCAIASVLTALDGQLPQLDQEGYLQACTR